MSLKASELNERAEKSEDESEANLTGEEASDSSVQSDREADDSEDDEDKEIEDYWKDDSDLIEQTDNQATSEQQPAELVLGADAEQPALPLSQRLLRLARSFEFETANRLLTELAGSGTSTLTLERDQRTRRTLIHYAAMHSKGQETLQLLINLVGIDSLTESDKAKMTPLHFASRYHSSKSLAPLLSQDANGDTCAHWAARNRRSKDALLAYLEAIGQQCLGWLNARRRTVLSEAMATCDAATAERLLAQAGSELLALKDEEGNSWAHYAADNRDEAVIFAAIEAAGPECLGWQNYRKQSVLHRILESCSVEVGKKLVALAGSETLSLRNEIGSTCLHMIDNNKEEILSAALDTIGPECLTWQNAKKQSVLYHAVLTCSTELCKKLVQEADSDCLSLRDEDGNTCLHEAVRSDSKIEIVLKAAQTVGWWCLGWQNNKKQTVLYLAVSSCSASAASHLLKMAPAEILRVDGDGNTLLHSLFQSEKHRHSDNEIQEFLSMMNTLVKSGVRLVCENNVGQNCLHSTTMLERCLALIMMKAATFDTYKKMFKQLLNNSSGLHAIHAFAGRYRLREIVKPLAKLSELQVPDLLRLTVTMDANKGATCLHFACEAGNKANIRYLLRQGLLLQNVTHSGMSCIDYAYEKGKLDEVLEVAEDCQKGLTMTDLWRLVDPAQRALKLPDRSNSRQLIASIAHESLRVEGPRGDSHSVCDDKPSKRRGSAVSLSEKPPETAVAVAKKDVSRTDWDVLLRAIELDSSRILRSAFSLNLVTSDTERCLPMYLAQKLNSDTYDSNRYFDKSEEFLNQKLFSVVSELLVIDVAAFFDKMNILPDLILTRQFELIPACISLLVYLKPKIAQRQGRLEQLKELQGKIICIVVNALDDLYMSASEEERNLLIDYIRGDLRDNNGENPGPMFPCRCADNADRSSFEYITLFDMVEESDCSELIETDCMHNVARKAWHPRPQYTEASGKKKRFTDPFTPKVKFYIHHVAFVIFLAYAAWYILDFKMTFYTVIPDILLSLYAASYTVQEFADFWRRRALKNFYVNKRIIRCPSYFQDAINLFDCFAILFLWIGLFWKWIIFYVVEDSNTTYACQMMLTISFTLWGFRSVAFLSYHERTGPVISMLSSLLILDLLPFLAIVMIIFYVFGVLFFNLLFPVIFSPASEMNGSGYAWKVILQVFTLPFNLLFTTFDTTSLEPSSATVNQTIGKVAHPQGLAWFKNLLLFVFLFLVNIVMVNLLIALFSLRVSRMDSRALGIWRRTYFEMLREYQTLGPLPPPVSFISEIVLPIMRFVRGARVQPTDKSEWWLNESDYPDEYVSFLRFQATRFRRCRPQLSREVTRNRSDFDGLKAHTGNLMDTLQEQLDSRLGAMADRQEETSQRLTGRLDKVEESLAQGVQVREQQQQVPATSDRLSQNLVPEAVIDDKLRALEARLTAELRAATSTVEPGPDAGPDDSRYRKTTSRLRQQRRKIKELDSKLDSIIELLKRN
uniref:ANK_REP_REGION domain-containing protein n=1 Tax=Macrostomum lignano TaxID=282301 RepID=A0A1I8HN98_9PLAT